MKILKTKLSKLQLITFFTLCISSLYSQVSIKGTVKNTNGDPVQFGTIQLLFDSIYHQSTLSDSLGNYSLKPSLKGDCELLTNCLGYSPAQKQVNLQTDTTINFTLQTDTIWMNEVTITSKKDLIQAKSDRLVINIGGNIETKGKETTDILKQLPTINVTQQSINMSGKTSVIVYINDRIVRLDGQSLLGYLNSLPSDFIESVEIISTPPAQYEAENNVGIVKIITKKNIQPGWKEYFRLGGMKNSYYSYVASGLVNYTGKKMFFEANIGTRNIDWLNQNEYFIYYPKETITTFNPKKWNFQGSNVNATLGYSFNENTNIIADFSAPISDREIIRDVENKTRFINPITEQIDSTIDSRGKTTKDKFTYNSELFFKHLFPNKKSYFTATTAYLNNYTLNSRSFTSSTQVGNTNLTIEDFYTEGSQKYDILTSKLDFSFPIFNCTVNTGGKLSFINTTSNSMFFNVINDNNILNVSLSNKYEYTEQVQALYCSMEKSIPDWSFKAGIRSEITQTNGKSFSTNDSHRNDYVDFFPTLFISHKLNSKSSLMFSYSNRIERPPYRMLDPFKWYITKYDYGVGNPFLQPAYISNFEITYMLNSTFSTKLYYTDRNDKIGQYVVLDSLNTRNQIEKPDNFLNENNYGVNIYKLLKLFNWLETTLQNDFYYSEYLSNRQEFDDVCGFGNTIIANNTVSLFKNLQGTVNMEEHVPGLYNYRNKENYFSLDIGFNFIFPKKGIEARLQTFDILKTADPEYYYSSGGVKQVYKNYRDTRVARLVVSWRLGNWYNKSSQISSPSNAEEKQRF